MKNTVVIFNAGIGALTLGFQNAGWCADSWFSKCRL